MKYVFEDLNKEIYDFVKSANAQLSSDDRIFYSCNFISGKLNNPQYLFIGLNPGYDDKEWEDRPLLTYKSWSLVPVGKYYLKNALEDIFGSKILDESALVNLHPIATPDKTILNTQTTNLGRLGLGEQYDKIKKNTLKTIIEELKPKKIVCIGVQTFDLFKKIFKFEVDTKLTKKANGHRLYLQSKCIETFPNIYGIIHLTGARVLNSEKAILKSCFNEENNE